MPEVCPPPAGLLSRSHKAEVSRWRRRTSCWLRSIWPWRPAEGLEEDGEALVAGRGPREGAGRLEGELEARGRREAAEDGVDPGDRSDGWRKEWSGPKPARWVQTRACRAREKGKDGSHTHESSEHCSSTFRRIGAILTFFGRERPAASAPRQLLVSVGRVTSIREGISLSLTEREGTIEGTSYA